MEVEFISIANFRNLSSQKICFCPGWNLIIGDNAQGKTNLVEAIDIFRFGFSFRTRQNNNLINHDCQKSSITLAFKRDGMSTEEKIILGRNEPIQFEKDGKKVKRSDIIGKFLSIVFSPDDLFISKGEPGIRRKYVDMLISQVNFGFYRALLDYRKALLQRNKLLRLSAKSIYGDETALIWEKSLDDSGKKIVAERQKAINWLGEKVKYYFSILCPDTDIDISYSPSWNMEKDGLLSTILAEKRANDMKCGFTSIGPHRDDINFDIDGRSSRKFGSQGQHRMLVIALKLSEIAFIQSVVDTTPVLILDDIFSELDENKIRALEKIIPSEIQVLATSTGIGFSDLFDINHKKHYMVSGHLA